MAPEGPRSQAQTQIELRARQRILEPAALDVQDGHLCRAGWSTAVAATCTDAAVESRPSVQSAGQRLEIAESAGHPHADPAR